MTRYNYLFQILPLIVIIFTVLYLVLTKIAKKQIEYISAGKNTNLFSLVATLVMTEVNPMALIAMASLGYMVGYRALFMAFIAFLSPLFASITTAKKWKNFDGACVTLIFDKYLGFSIGNMVRLIFLISLMILSATYLKGVIIYSEVLFPNLPSSIAIASVISFCVLTVVNKGLYGIIRMDIVGIILTICVALIFLLYTFQSGSSEYVDKAQEFGKNSPLPAKYLTALLVLQMIMYSISPWWGQKLFSAKNTNTAYFASIISSFFLFFLYSSFIFGAIYLKNYGVNLSDPELAFPMVIKTVIPRGLSGFCTITFFYIATTTICGVWSPMVGIITSGFLKYKDKDSAKLNYIIWVILGVITYYLSLYKIENVLQSAVLAVMQLCSIYFSVIAIFYFKTLSKMGSIVSMWISIVIGYCLYFYVGEEGNYIWYWVILGLPAMFITGYFFSLKSNVFERISRQS